MYCTYNLCCFMSFFKGSEYLSNKERDGSEQGAGSSKIIAPVVVIGSLIVGLLVLLIYRRRSNREFVFDFCSGLLFRLSMQNVLY